MSAAETLDISDLVFVNWAQGNYELSTISDDNYSLSSENISEISVSSEIGSSYFLVTSSHSSKYMIRNEDAAYDLSILLHLFDDYKSVNTSDFPHLYVEFMIPSTSIMVLSTLFLVGLLYFLASLISILPKTGLNAKSVISYQNALIVTPSLMHLDQIYPQEEVQAQITQNYISKDAFECLKETKKDIIKSKPIKASNVKSQSPRQPNILLKLWILAKTLIRNAQIFVKRRVYKLRRDIRFFILRNK